MLLERASRRHGKNLPGRGSRFGARPSMQRKRECWAEHLIWVSKDGGAEQWWEGSRCEEAYSNILSRTKLLCHWWFRKVLLTVLGFIMGATAFFSWCF